MTSEIEILKSIYPDFVSTDASDESFIRLEVPVYLGEPRAVLLRDGESTLRLSLSNLPPLLLHVILVPGYPLHIPPDLSIRSSWLPPPLTVRLRSTLRGIWKPEESVLFDWVEFIRSGAFLEALNVSLPSGDILLAAPQRIGELFTSYDNSTRSALFSQQAYNCAVCLASVKGAKCVQLSCTHVFCRACLDEFWSLRIKEGDIEYLGCPEIECVKVRRTANEEEIASAVSPRAVKRWLWLREKIMFEKDPSLVHCPMQHCQSPVPRPPESTSDFGADKLRICSACSFSFCCFCKRSWHGAVQHCPISQTETVVLEYLALSEGSKERQVLEARYGKILLGKLIARYEEDQLNKEWLEANAVSCPGCELRITKSVGCNHMTCSRCQTHLCYRCGSKLDKSKPYAHFSNAGSACFNQLFDFTNEDRAWVPFL
ncbi:hypothetical protein C8F01DRAFT_1109743 [Mycena amicta]|nr:hypothetical protein C8F01DRAFT_1109743 [Mycena amicta]